MWVVHKHLLPGWYGQLGPEKKINHWVEQVVINLIFSLTTCVPRIFDLFHPKPPGTQRETGCSIDTAGWWFWSLNSSWLLIICQFTVLTIDDWCMDWYYWLLRIVLIDDWFLIDMSEYRYYWYCCWTLVFIQWLFQPMGTAVWTIHGEVSAATIGSRRLQPQERWYSDVFNETTIKDCRQWPANMVVTS